MSHLELQSYYGDWYVIEGEAGTVLLPIEVHGHELPLSMDSPEFVADHALHELQPYYDGAVIAHARTVKGWGARLSAPGYLDCTPWMGVYATESEALAELEAVYGDD